MIFENVALRSKAIDFLNTAYGSLDYDRKLKLKRQRAALDYDRELRASAVANDMTLAQYKAYMEENYELDE